MRCRRPADAGAARGAARGAAPAHRRARARERGALLLPLVHGSWGGRGEDEAARGRGRGGPDFPDGLNIKLIASRRRA